MKNWIPLTLLCLSAGATSFAATAKGVRAVAGVSKASKPAFKKKNAIKRVKKTAPAASARDKSPNA